jgi:septal ring factor EnvC (AmiA/AmiB activator)
MADESTFLSSGVIGAWSAILTAAIAYIGYFAKKRDDAIDDNAKAITSLRLNVAENYATKPTMLALFQEATQQTKDAVARVEKSIDSTNASVTRLDGKIDNVNTSINTAVSNIMHELAKKT